MDKLRNDVTEGRAKVQAQIDKLKMQREEVLQRMRDDFEELRYKIAETMGEAVAENQRHQDEVKRRCELELEATEFEKQVHLQLIDALYESQGQVIFSEVLRHSTEFRFFNLEVVEAHTSQECLVIGGAIH